MAAGPARAIAPMYWAGPAGRLGFEFWQCPRELAVRLFSGGDPVDRTGEDHWCGIYLISIQQRVQPLEHRDDHRLLPIRQLLEAVPKPILHHVRRRR